MDDHMEYIGYSKIIAEGNKWLDNKWVGANVYAT